MSDTWCEVEQANAEKRCELVLVGQYVSERIKETGLDSNIFKITNLNFLEISKTCLTELPKDIGNLVNLTRVVLCNNNLEKLPADIGKLKKLKFLDVSFNAITHLPEEVGTLAELQSLNASNNKLSSLPSSPKFLNLVTINIAHNEFEELPISICNQNHARLLEVKANNNKILSIPAEIALLGALKVLDLGNNEMTMIPSELSDCIKLKELNLKGNRLKDKRLLKLVDQCHMKQVLEYVRSHGSKDDGKQAKSKKKAKQSKKVIENDEVNQLVDQIKVLHVRDDTTKVILAPNIQEIRPYIVCCIIHNVNLEEDNALKRFITLQTKLHEGICERRTIATIATHDMAKINGDLRYDSKAPKEIKITPLGKKNEITAFQLYEYLNEEADALRKEKKKNTYSGIHKYLYLLKDKPLYPCLLDSEGKVISFPPITNSDGTKISDKTNNIFVEVTGNNLTSCKKVMDSLLHETLKLGIGGKAPEENESNDTHSLTVEQVRIVDEEGHLKVVYPSRTDIMVNGVNVIHQ